MRGYQPNKERTLATKLSPNEQLAMKVGVGKSEQDVVKVYDQMAGLYSNNGVEATRGGFVSRAKALSPFGTLR